MTDWDRYSTLDFIENIKRNPPTFYYVEALCRLTEVINELPFREVSLAEDLGKGPDLHKVPRF